MPASRACANPGRNAQKPIPRLPVELIERCLLALPVSERTPDFLLRLRKEGSVLKSVAMRDMLWAPFVPKAATKSKQSRCDAFLERMNDRSSEGNAWLFGLYQSLRSKAAPVSFLQRDESFLEGSFRGDPELEVASILSEQKLSFCGRVTRNDEAIVLPLVAAWEERLVNAEALPWVHEVPLLPAKFWTKTLAIRFIRAHEETWATDLVPRRFFGHRDLLELLAWHPGIYRHIPADFRKDFTFIESLLTKFFADDMPEDAKRLRYMMRDAERAEVLFCVDRSSLSKLDALARIFEMNTFFEPKIETLLRIEPLISTAEELQRIFWTWPALYPELCAARPFGHSLLGNARHDEKTFEIALKSARKNKIEPLAQQIYANATPEQRSLFYGDGSRKSPRLAVIAQAVTRSLKRKFGLLSD